MYGDPYKMYGASYILYVAANTCMVRAVLYCTVLRAFSHFHAIYRCFPYNSARNSYFPLHLCAGPVGDSGAQINQPTGAQVQYEHCLGTLREIHIQMYFLYLYLYSYIQVWLSWLNIQYRSTIIARIMHVWSAPYNAEFCMYAQSVISSWYKIHVLYRYLYK